MRKGITLEKIEKEIKRLAPQEQLKLVERIISQLRKTGLAREHTKRNWCLGSHIRN